MEQFQSFCHLQLAQPEHETSQSEEVATTQITSSHVGLRGKQFFAGTTTQCKLATTSTHLSDHSSRKCSSMVHKSHAQRRMAPAAALLLSLHLRRHCRAFPEQALQIRCPRLQQVHGLEQKVSHRMDLAESENHIHADSGFGRAQRPRNLNANIKTSSGLSTVKPLPGWERQTKGTLSAFRTLELRVLFDLICRAQLNGTPHTRTNKSSKKEQHQKLEYTKPA